MDKPDVIEIDDDPTLPWEPVDWIKAGKKYPTSNTPPHILSARSAILEMPPHMLLMLPDRTLSVVDLLKYALPVKSTTLVLSQVSDAYTPLEPNEDLNILATRPVPPEQMNAVLREQVTTRARCWDRARTSGRWKSTAPGGRSGEETSALAGNAANAELAAGQRASTV
jgi:hypothetical protein